jgi:hypothetical protein
LLLGSLLAAVTHAAAVTSDLSEKQANKFRKHLDCNGFETTFTITKSMLYDQAKPPASDYFYIGGVDANKELAGFRRDNWGCKGKFRAMTRPRGQVVEKAATFTLDWFDANDLNNCGIKLTETITGGLNGMTNKINVQFIIFGDPRSDIGKADAALPDTTRVIQVECEVARTVDDWTYQYQHDVELTPNLAHLGTQPKGALIKKSGLFKSDVFETYDVRTGFTRAFHPYTEQHRMAKPGEPMLVGVRPKPDYRWGTNYNPIAKHGKRWRFYTDNCVWSGLTDPKDATSTVDIELINGGCKSIKYNVEILSKFGRNKDGHLFMFEAMGFGDGNLAYLTCNVKICFVKQDGTLDGSCAPQPKAACATVGTFANGDKVYYMNPITGETDCDKDNENVPCVLVSDGDRLGSQDYFIAQETFELTTTTPVNNVFATLAADAAAEPESPPTDLPDAATALPATVDPPATAVPGWHADIANVFSNMDEAWTECKARFYTNPVANKILADYHRFVQLDRDSHPFALNDAADGEGDNANADFYDDFVSGFDPDDKLYKACKILYDMLQGDYEANYFSG